MTDDLRNGHGSIPVLEIEPVGSHTSFSKPTKRINDGDDLSFFLRSMAYADIMTFVLQLNRSMIPKRHTNESETYDAWPLNKKQIQQSPNVVKLKQLVEALEALIEKAPPETGPRRFGNVAFRKWYSAAQEATPSLLREALSENVWDRASDKAEQEALSNEVAAYLMGSFGSPERLDYGTGHELSFIAFLGCIWKLGGFAQAESGVEERGIVEGIIQPYLGLVRKLILAYTLEPAGSHGVWGLDDHSFIPYILGSAQYCPPIDASPKIPTEGSLSGAPSPTRTAKRDSAEKYRESNMYFSAIAFIFDVKTGPFWEHSPTLYDISGIKDGWAKINKGMVKMYNAEVLSKFPVVQHFQFGSLFPWKQDPRASMPITSAHMGSQPRHSNKPSIPNANYDQPSVRATEAGMSRPLSGMPTTSAPWAATEGSSSGVNNLTRAPWARAPPGPNRPA